MKLHEILEAPPVTEGLKSMYHKAMAKRHARKADDAVDAEDGEGFAKHMDQNIKHRLKAGETIPQVPDPARFLSKVK